MIASLSCVPLREESPSAAWRVRRGRAPLPKGGLGATFFGRALQEPPLPAIGVREVALKPRGVEWRGAAQKNGANMSHFLKCCCFPRLLPVLVAFQIRGCCWFRSGLFSCRSVTSLLARPKRLAGTLKARVAMGSWLCFFTVFHGTVPRDILVLCSFSGQKIQVHAWSWIRAGLSDPEVPALEISG